MFGRSGAGLTLLVAALVLSMREAECGTDFLTDGTKVLSHLACVLLEEVRCIWIEHPSCSIVAMDLFSPNL